jgi:hypothetical protein
MRTNRLAMVAVLAMACDDGPMAPSLRAPADVVQDEARLQTGDVIEIEVRLSGCFHDHHFAVALRIDGDSAIVERFSGRGNIAAGYRFQAIEALTRRQLDGMFRLMDEYRRPTKQSCTASEAGRLRVVRDGVALYNREFKDSACRGFGERHPAFHWFMLADVVKGTAAVRR